MEITMDANNLVFCGDAVLCLVVGRWGLVFRADCSSLGFSGELVFGCLGQD